MTGEARVVALDRLWPGDIADRSGDLLDIVFGWTDFAKLRCLVAGQCAAAGLTGTRLDDFVLAVSGVITPETADKSLSSRRGRLAGGGGRRDR
jgi:hypothetical protein